MNLKKFNLINLLTIVFSALALVMSYIAIKTGKEALEYTKDEYRAERLVVWDCKGSERKIYLSPSNEEVSIEYGKIKFPPQFNIEDVGINPSVNVVIMGGAIDSFRVWEQKNYGDSALYKLSSDELNRTWKSEDSGSELTHEKVMFPIVILTNYTVKGESFLDCGIYNFNSWIHYKEGMEEHYSICDPHLSFIMRVPFETADNVLELIMSNVWIKTNIKYP